MQDVPFFLLKNLLPVGLSAIVFFGIGLLFAKLIWGRYNQRLSNAIEENMNLASQWSALGSSQQDLFKKLRVRWQTDRDAYESELAEKDRRIALLTESFQKSGKTLPDEQVLAAAGESVARLAKIEAELAAERAVTARLRADLEQGHELPVLPFAVPSGENGIAAEVTAPQDELVSRVRDLEQDLIDTHDELHRVRVDYQTQLQLVEALEAKLIAAPSAPAAVVSAAAPPVEEKAAPDGEISPQIRALLAQRSRELRHARVHLAGASATEVQALRTELSTARAQVDALRTQVESGESLVAELREQTLARQTELESFQETVRTRESEIAEQTLTLAARQAELEALQDAREALQGELESARTQLDEIEPLRRRRGDLQAQLNDACHELYDVRRALLGKVTAVTTLEERLGFLAGVEADKTALEAELVTTRAQVTDLESRIATLSAKLADAEVEASQLHETRRKLSELRIALSSKTADYDQARAQMDELEAIIEDRGAEVNDLSAELRQQRDQVRLLKEDLAGKQGELEALSEESRILNAGVKARAQFTEGLQARVTTLEHALVERYNELNQARSESDDHARRAKRFETEATHLGAELDRRAQEFNDSDRRIFNAERALEESGRRIDDLTRRLGESDTALAELREELVSVSRDKEEALRDFERASHRVAEMEDAARKREIELIEIQRALRDSEALLPPLQQRIERLQAERDSALEESRLAQVAIGELEDALRASDERTLQLSGRLDEKEIEAATLASELVELKALLDQHRAGEAEAQVRLASLEKEAESRIAAIRGEKDAFAESQARESTLLAGEVATLREQLQAETAARAAEAARLEFSLAEAATLRQELEARATEIARLEANLAEIETLRARLDERAETIRDLQSEISIVMMQRTTREQEITELKEKIEALSVSPALPDIPESTPRAEEQALVGETEDRIAATATVDESAAGEFDDTEENVIPLEALDLPEGDFSDAPPAAEPVAAEREEMPVGASISDEEHSVFFPEGSAALARSEMEKIDRCASAVRRLGRKIEIHVVGFSGGEGTPDFVQSLSAHRADAVRERLFERGVQQAVVKVRVVGQDRRFSDWRARRVEMIVSPVAVAEAVN